MGGIASGITGAAPIWHDIMSYLLENKKVEKPNPPADVIGMSVCTPSGLLPNPASPCSTRFEYFLKGKEPKAIDPGNQNVWVDKTTQDLPVDPKQTDNLELKSENIVTDPTNDRYCLSCPHPTPTPLPTPHP